MCTCVGYKVRGQNCACMCACVCGLNEYMDGWMDRQAGRQTDRQIDTSVCICIDGNLSIDPDIVTASNGR